MSTITWHDVAKGLIDAIQEETKRAVDGVAYDNILTTRSAALKIIDLAKGLMEIGR